MRLTLKFISLIGMILKQNIFKSESDFKTIIYYKNISNISDNISINKVPNLRIK